MATGTEDEGREEFLAGNRARRAKIRADEEEKAEKAARRAGDDAEDEAPDAPDPDEADADEAGAGGQGEADAATSTTPPRDARPASRVLVTVLGIATAVLAVAVGVLSYFLATSNSDSGVDNRVVAVAKDYASTVLTYSSGDYADLDKRIRAISTPDFADRYITSSQQAREGNDEAQAKGTAVAKEAGVVSISDTKAVVLVAVDQSVKSPLVPAVGSDGLDYQSRVKITLTRDGDDWKLSDLSVV